MTFRAKKEKNIPYNSTEYQKKTAEFFATHPIFSLDEAARTLAPNGGRLGMVERLKYHLKVGTLKLAVN